MNGEATRFKNGNPGGGRPKGTKNRSTLLKKWLEVATKAKGLDGDDFTGTFEDKVVIALIDKAMKGDVIAIKEIFDTLYGKVAEKNEIKTEGDILIKLTKGGNK